LEGLEGGQLARRLGLIFLRKHVVSSLLSNFRLECNKAFPFIIIWIIIFMRCNYEKLNMGFLNHGCFSMFPKLNFKMIGFHKSYVLNQLTRLKESFYKLIKVSHFKTGFQ